ncbi:rhodanese-like domain-containing protein [Haloplasma contractile]|uniref:Rhodanese family protein n=1 Tax=Haloplasma contractile SSD-17B TaxID=1033810 RepID=U2FF66_9MOLU|nr:rhodanese-like domain-containing protein [Haloplasma contractile]ERJ11555.1 Rhodanese family protein [Haloplasma contractile SSD-17B]
MYKTITTKELKSLIDLDEPINIIDVREQFEHRTGHVPGSVNVPVNTLIQGASRYLKKEEPNYIICQSGSRSQLVCQLLLRQGYQVIDVLGGHGAYNGPLNR